MATVFDPETGVREITREYLSCAETAKLIRAALKTAFPAVRFSVRSHTYSGGASIHIRYTDGPPQSDVESVAKRYEGAGFDGMIDLKTYNEDWLMPDGSVVSCRSEIGHSYRSDAQTPQPAPSSKARLVHFGADYVFVDRDLSQTTKELILAALKTVNPQLADAVLDDWRASYVDVWAPSLDDDHPAFLSHLGASAEQLVRTAAEAITFA